MSKEISKKNTRPKLEIERKFLLRTLPSDLNQYTSNPIRQGYIRIEEDGTEERVRQEGNKYTHTTKTTVINSKGKIRVEDEKEITRDEFESIWPQTTGRRVEKIRYTKGNIFIDVYQNDLNGLVTAEIEFQSEEESNNFKVFDWLGEEVTTDKKFKNQNLARFGLPKIK